MLASILNATDVVDVDQAMTEFGVKADGPVMTLPGGDLRLAVGGEARRETQKGSRLVGSPSSLLSVGTGYLSQGSADADRNILSALAEASVPLVGPSQAIPLVDGLVLSLAVRHDDYSDAGGTTNPKVGVDWTVVEGLRLFGSWSKAFQAPPLGSTAAGAVDTRVQPLFGGPPPFSPTLAGCAETDGIVIAGGSGALQPQKSKNYSYGLEFKPQFLTGFRMTATYWHVDFQNYIGIPFPGTYTNPALAAYGILAPKVNGVIVPFTPTSPEVTRFTSVLPVDGGVLPSKIYYIGVLQRVNLAQRLMSGVDFDVSQSLDVAQGALTLRLTGALLSEDKSAGVPGGTLVDALDADNKLNYTVSADYRHKAWYAGASWNHLDSRYTTAAKTFKAKAFDVANLRAGYDFGSVSLTFNIDNLFDKAPVHQQDAAGGIATVNPYGRLVSMGVTKSW